MIARKLLVDIASLAARRVDKEILMLLKKKVKSLESEYPDWAREISKTISNSGGVGALRRFHDLSGIPVDSDSGMELLVVEDVIDIPIIPILDSKSDSAVDRFIRERRNLDKLRSAGVRPPTSLALMGPPGTGKTTLARWIAKQLNLPFMALNLASVVTSYFGQTGQNIKKALDRSRIEPSVLLLDEFDALGKIRSDGNDVGEMNRVVTVLLQEIEKWPDHSVIMAATNLPELIDPAFRRRFSSWIRLELPNQKERLRILKAHYKGNLNSSENLDLAAICLTGASGSDLGNFVNRVMAKQIVDSMSPSEALLEELYLEVTERNLSEDIKRDFIQTARKINKKKYTYRKLGKVLEISHTTAIRLAKEI